MLCIFAMQMPANAEDNLQNYQTYAEVVPERVQSSVVNDLAIVKGVTPDIAQIENFSDRVVVQIRTEEFIKAVEAREGRKLVYEPFLGDMVAVLMLDSEETISAVYYDELSAHDVDETVVFELAHKNTRDRMGEVISNPLTLNVEQVMSGNGLISGQMTLPETCAVGTQDQVYFLYDYNGVLKVDAEDMLGVARLAAYARNLILTEKSLSNTVMMCQDGEWLEVAQGASVRGFTF